VRRDWFQTNRHLYFGAYFWCRVVLVHLVPCSALIVLNALLVREMRRAQRRRAHLLAINMRRNECRRLADSNVTTSSSSPSSSSSSFVNRKPRKKIQLTVQPGLKSSYGSRAMNTEVDDSV